jgi:hypothetical protein
MNDLVNVRLILLDVSRCPLEPTQPRPLLHHNPNSQKFLDMDIVDEGDTID